MPTGKAFQNCSDFFDHAIHNFPLDEEQIDLGVPFALYSSDLERYVTKTICHNMNLWSFSLVPDLADHYVVCLKLNKDLFCEYMFEFHHFPKAMLVLVTPNDFCSLSVVSGLAKKNCCSGMRLVNLHALVCL